MQRLNNWLTKKLRALLEDDFVVLHRLIQVAEGKCEQRHESARKTIISLLENERSYLQADTTGKISVIESQVQTAVERQVAGLVHEKLAELQSHKTRHVACPTCGKSYNLDVLSVPYYTHSVTISCNGCGNHFEVRPNAFWQKLEVERR